MKTSEPTEAQLTDGVGQVFAQPGGLSSSLECTGGSEPSLLVIRVSRPGDPWHGAACDRACHGRDPSEMARG